MFMGLILLDIAPMPGEGIIRLLMEATENMLILTIPCVVIVLFVCIYFIRKHRNNSRNDSGLSNTLRPY